MVFLKKCMRFFVVCLRFALIIITWQINNYLVLNDFIQLLLVNVSVFDFLSYFFLLRRIRSNLSMIN